MRTITLSVPEELKIEMDEFGEINWSAVAREAIKGKVKQLKLLKTIVSKSKFTEKDALELGKKINKSLHERFKSENSGEYWMEFVVDANVIISILISPTGKTCELLFSDKFRTACLASYSHFLVRCLINF